jgi:NADH:ubiquinone reductase (H+-translocating)
MSDRHRVVIIGSGFGGLFAAKALKRAPVDVTVVANTPHHLFQPLLYQVATGILSQGEIAPATREILRRQRNCEVRLGDVTAIDLASKTVTVHVPASELTIENYRLTYDTLIVAAGAGQSYFGHDEFAEFAPGMKSIDDALELRGRIFGSFELAEVEPDPVARQRWMTFVVVGAGPTGVEMAGQITELAHRTLPGDFRNIDPHEARIVLLDAAPMVLPAFGDHLSERARRRLAKIGVDVRLDAMVTGVDEAGIEFNGPNGPERIEAFCKIWAAGVSASPLARQLAEQSGADLDRAGRIKVNPDLTLPGHPEVFAIGDMATLNELPGVAQVAIQGAKHAAKLIKKRLKGGPEHEPFSYFDKGSMATISRFSAVASVGKLRLSGFVAWLMWLVVHLVYLVGFKNRFTALMHWLVSFIGRGRSERTVTLQQVFARTMMRRDLP